jgi:hypothetical protein
MKTSFKEKGVVICWLIGFIVVISLFGYFIFAKPKTSVMLTSGVEIVNLDDMKQIETSKKYKIPYAFKLIEEGKFYLRYHYNENNVPVEIKLELTNEQYNKLFIGNKYWLMIRYSRNSNGNTGRIENISTEDPMRK